MGRLGRPRKLNPELIEAICERIRKGVPQSVAAGAEGVAESTFYYWKQRGAEGKPGDEIYRDFLEAVACAWHCATSEMVEDLRHPVRDDDGKADGVSSQNTRWLLERTRRNDFGQQIDIRAKSEAVDHVLDRLRQGLDPETYAAVLGCLAGESGGGEAAGDGRH